MLSLTAPISVLMAMGVGGSAFISSHSSARRTHAPALMKRDNGTGEESASGNRREALFYLSSIAGTVAAAATADPAFGRDELFRPNPLTNPVLEQFRIWEQAEQDNIKYGGELASGSPKGRETYSKLLVPILSIEQDIIAVNDLVHQEGDGLGRARSLLSKPDFEKLAFKKVFNAYGDNIYYSDPDRANMYLGGGAVPKSEQSIAYLLRNDLLTNIESLQAEVEYVIKQKKRIDSGNEQGPLETADLYEYAQNAKDAMAKYLELVPPQELKAARQLLLS